MQVRVGDIVRVGAQCAGHFFGVVVEIKKNPFVVDGTRVATLWRPELPPAEQIQTWPLDAQYQIEVVR